MATLRNEMRRMLRNGVLVKFTEKLTTLSV
jgi:hypothetical protein